MKTNFYFLSIGQFLYLLGQRSLRQHIAQVDREKKTHLGTTLVGKWQLANLCHRFPLKWWIIYETMMWRFPKEF